MDPITRRIIARAHLEQFKEFAPEVGKAAIEDTISKWDSLVSVKGFDDLIGSINAAAQRLSGGSTDIERGQHAKTASLMGAQCGSFLVKAEGHLNSIRIEPRPAGGGKTGIKPSL